MDLTEFRNFWVASEDPQYGEKLHTWWVCTSNEAEEGNEAEEAAWKALPVYLNVPMEIAMSCYLREKEKWESKIATRAAEGKPLTWTQARLHMQWVENDSRKLVFDTEKRVQVNPQKVCLNTLRRCGLLVEIKFSQTNTDLWIRFGSGAFSKLCVREYNIEDPIPGRRKCQMASLRQCWL